MREGAAVCWPLHSESTEPFRTQLGVRLVMAVVQADDARMRKAGACFGVVQSAWLADLEHLSRLLRAVSSHRGTSEGRNRLLLLENRAEERVVCSPGISPRTWWLLRDGRFV